MKNKMLRIGLICIVLVVSSIFMMGYSKNLSRSIFYLESKWSSPDKLRDKLIRLHVIANSDEDIDQKVKLKVKDAVLEELTPALDDSKSKGQSLEILKDRMDSIEEIAEDTLKDNGMDNDVSVVLNESFFPTKYYNDFTLPAGDYLALRVVIGSGEGKNWWCVLFPPLCLVDVQREELGLAEGKGNQENQLVDEDEKVDIEIDKGKGLANEAKPRMKWKALEILGLYKK